jgi:hypothetical protein
MKTSQILLSKIIFAAIFTIHTFSSWAQSDTLRPFHAGLVFPISSNGLKAGEYTNRFSLHAIAGLSKNETGAAVAGAVNVIKSDAHGAVVSGVMNLVGNSADGVQVAGFANIVKHEAAGAQIAGTLNLAGSAKGVQVAGFSNLTHGDAGGLQIAGFSNLTGGNVKGMQVSGFLNTSRNVNSQVAGAINIAKNVKGVQIAGLINIADSSDYPIAILNFVKNGEKSIGVSVDETLTTMATFRSGGRVLYGILGVGYNFKDDGRSVYAMEAGLGAHIPVVGSFRINTEVVNQNLSDFKKGDYAKYSLRILPSYKIKEKIEIFGGPTVNYSYYSNDKGYDYIAKFIWNKTGSSHSQGVYIGFNAGVGFNL